MADEVNPFEKRVIDELDTLWTLITNVEVTAIKAGSDANVTKAKLRTYESKLYRLIDECSDLRDELKKLMPDDNDVSKP